MKFNKISVIALLLVLCMLALAACVGDAGSGTETDTGSEVDPGVTEPAETDPDETDPVETDPVETDPVVIDPVETDPVETDPKETDPKETDPVETDPVETTPSVGPHICVGAVMSTDATCYQEGVHTTVCTICGKVMSKSSYASRLPHTPDEANPATCLKPQLCIVCNEVVVEPLGHDFVSAYATEADEPTCTDEGTLTYTCKRNDNAEEHEEGSEGAVYTETVPTVPHSFVGEPVYTAPSLLVAGSLVGECEWCGPGAETPIDPQVLVDFENQFSVETLTGEALNAAGSPIATDFVGSLGSDTAFTIVTEGENTYLKKTNAATLTLTDKSEAGVLAFEKFEISFDLHVDSMATDGSTNYSGGIFSVKDGGERRVLSLMGGKRLCFGKLDTGVYLLNSDIFQNGEAEWINIKVVVDPTTYDYEIWLDGEKVLYTEIVEGDASKHTIYTPDGDGWKATEVSSSSSNLPFNMSGKGINELYFFHFSNWCLSVDNLTIKIPERHTCNSTTEVVPSTCIKLGYTRTYCTICGEETSRTDNETYADHVYNIEAATCTENKKCTVCGEIAEKALGHSDSVDVVDATFCTPGSLKGFCDRCEEELDEIIPAGITMRFDAVANDTTTADSDFGDFAPMFTPGMYSGSIKNYVVANDGYIEKIKGGSGKLHLADNTGFLDKGDFTVSFDFKLTADAASNGGLFGFNNRSAGVEGQEMRVLSIDGGERLYFAGVDSQRSVVLKQLSYGEDAPWTNVKIVVTRATLDYEIWLDGEKVLYTETEAGAAAAGHVIYLTDGQGGFKTTDAAKDIAKYAQQPFQCAGGAIKSIYMFHAATNNGVAIDNFSVSMAAVEHNYVDHHEDATCMTPEKDCKKCTWCGDEIDVDLGEIDPNAHHPGEPVSDGMATCLEGGNANVYCTVDGCGKLLETITTEPLDHVWGDWEYAGNACEATSRSRACTGNNTTECEEVQTEDCEPLPHEFDGETTYVAPSLLVPGSETGTCSICQKTATNVIAPMVKEDFEDIAVDSALKDVVSTDAFAWNGDFTYSDLSGSGTSTIKEETEGGNRYWHAVMDQPSTGLTFKDNTGRLAYETFEVSMKVKFNNTTGSGRVLSLKGSAETALLSYNGGKLVFGTNKSGATPVADQTVLSGGWVEVRVVVDPLNVDYKIYVEDQLVLYTEKQVDGSHKIYDSNGKEQSTHSEKSPFSVSGKIHSLYMFHFAKVDMAIDDFCVRIPEFHKCEDHIQQETVASTCKDLGYTREYCALCNKELSKTPLETLADHEYEMDVATCTEDKVCKNCGYIGQKATGHSGTTTVAATFCKPGSITGTCSVCGEVNETIPAGIVETFDGDTVGAKASFSTLSKAFDVKKVDAAVTVGEYGGNKYLSKSASTGVVDLYSKADVLSGNSFTVSFDFAANNTNQGGLLGLNSRAKVVYDGEGNEINFKTEGTASSHSFDEMRILSEKSGGGINFWGVNTYTATDGTSHEFRLLNTGSAQGEYFHFEIEVYPTLTNGILTCIDYKIYIEGELVLESVDKGTYVNVYDNRTYPVKEIKWRTYGNEEFTTKTFEMPTPTWLAIKDVEGVPTLYMKNKDGVLCPFYTTRSFHEGEPMIQIESLHFFHWSTASCDLDNLSVSMMNPACVFEHKTVDPTCEDSGSEWDECIFCGDKKNEQTIPADATKHVQSELLTRQPAECTVNGVAYYECTVCGQQLGEDVPIPMTGHTLDEATVTVVTPATFTTEGTAKGTCTVCSDTQATTVIRRQVVADFDDMQAGALSTDMLTSALSPFTASYNGNTKAEQTIVEETGGNKYWHVKYAAKGNGVSFADGSAEKLLNTATWKLSMRVRFYNDTDDARFLSWRPTGGTERALLAYYKGKLAFGKNGNSAWHTVIADGDTIKKGDEYQWINLAIEVDPVQRTYKVYIEDELVLYTEATTNDIYKLVDGNYEKQAAIPSDRTPFAAGGTVDHLYGFHQGICEMDIDDFKIEIMEYLPASAE